MAIVEELFVRDQDTWDPKECPLGGFTWSRRRLPTTTVARGEGNTVQKCMKMVHSVILENSEEGLWPWRCSVKNFLSDQGTEKGICRVPMGGKERDARSVLTLSGSDRCVLCFQGGPRCDRCGGRIGAIGERERRTQRETQPRSLRH